MRPALAAAALVALLPACSGGGGGSASPPASAAAAPAAQSPATPAPAAPPPSRWWAGDLHVHTLHSGDGFDTIAQTLAMARYQRLDYIVLSDHDTLTQRADPDAVSGGGLEVAFGHEWTQVAHGGVIGPRTVQPPLGTSPGAWLSEAQAVIDNVHAEGGVFVMNHPTWVLFPWVLPVARADAVEVWNNYWTTSDIGFNPCTTSSVQQRMTAKGLTAAGATIPPEIARAAARPGTGNDQALFFWEELLARGDRVAAVGGSDRHRYFLPGYPTTWVFAPGATEADVVAAIRDGRTMVTDGPRGPRVYLEVDTDGDGEFEATIGDTIRAGRVSVRVRVESAPGGLVRLLRRRAVAHESRISGDPYVVSTTVTVQPGDWLRVDVFKPIDWSFRNVLPIYPPVTTNQPVVDCLEQYLRILNADITGATFDTSRAAITSAIYVR